MELTIFPNDGLFPCTYHVRECPKDRGTAANGFNYKQAGRMAIWRCMGCTGCVAVRPRDKVVECDYKADKRKVGK